ncbi:ABC transporter substrate-binding subunit SaoX [Desulfonatronum sp. SC1]|uniref:ABC transporter substrate-binding subunit SaoX n=1 Tax=Desulfonatronum sp. SC1 TaxID=2109626 RepID=UPI001304E0C5|nr:ABC transporter substrate-binding subunit SaoX [Desulfonatronum sp. SC1]
MYKYNIKNMTRREFLRASSFMGVALTGATVPLLTGCTKEEVAGKDNYSVQIGYYDCDHMVAAPISRDRGLLMNNGVNNFRMTGNGQVPQAMTAGHMDVGYVGTTTIERAFRNGAPIRVVANNHRGGSWYLVAANHIKEAKDLIGKRVSLGAHPNPFWCNCATQVDIPWQFEHYDVYVMTDRDEYVALMAGHLDGYTCCDPWGSMAEYSDVGWIVATNHLLQDGSWGACCDLVMRDAFIEQHRELAKLCLKTHIDALMFVYEQPYKAAETFASDFKVPLPVAIKTIWRKTNAEGTSMTWRHDVSEKERQFAYSKSLGLPEFQETAPPAEWMDDTLLKEIGAPDFYEFIEKKVKPYFPDRMSLEDWTDVATKRHTI